MNRRAPRWVAWLSLPILLLLWEAISTRYPSYVFPSPFDVWLQAGVQFRSPVFYGDVGLSLARIAVGLVIASIGAFLLGVLAGFRAVIREILAPMVSFFQATPPLAWAPLFMVMMGLGNAPMIAVIVMASFFPILINILQGMDRIAESHVRAGRMLGANGWRLGVFVFLPEVMPSAITGVYVGFGVAWRSLVAAEMIGGNAGLGYFISTNGQVGNPAAVMLGILVVGFLALLLDWLLLRPLKNRYTLWAERA